MTTINEGSKYFQRETAALDGSQKLKQGLIIYFSISNRIKFLLQRNVLGHCPFGFITRRKTTTLNRVQRVLKQHDIK